MAGERLDQEQLGEPGALGLDPVRDLRVLSPTNRGGLGARSLNVELQRALNPAGEFRVERFGWTHAVGDKVRQIENADKEADNGDGGFITGIDADAAQVAIDFDGRQVACDVGELDEVVPAYATELYKAQGSEYHPAAVIPLVTQHYAMLRRNLVCTAVTRGKRLVVIVGRPKALALTVKGAQARRRSRLKDWRGGEPERAQ